MQHAGHTPTLQFLAVLRDERGAFAKVRVRQQHDEVTIRWGLDAFTYDHIPQRLRVEGVGVPNTVSSELQWYLQDVVPVPHEGRYVAFLRASDGAQTASLSFLCSELFAANLEWARSHQNWRQLAALAWEDTPTDTPMIPIPDPTTSAFATETASATTATPATEATFATAGAVSSPSPSRAKVRPTIVLFSLSVLATASAIFVMYDWQLRASWLLRSALAAVPSRPAHTAVEPVPSATRVLPDPAAALTTSLPSEFKIDADSLLQFDSHWQPLSRSSYEFSSVAQIRHPSLAGQSVPQIFSVPAGEVALSIDDGPSPYTQQIVEVLKQYHVTATFFFVGSRVMYWPAAVQAAAQAGDVIGNHSEDHPLMTGLSVAQQEREIQEATRNIQAYDPYPITLFRPPYGAYNAVTEEVMHKNHLSLALWNRDPKDWAATTPAQIVQSILQTNPSGGVIDLHDRRLTLDALPELIQKLSEQHLHFVTLSAAVK